MARRRLEARRFCQMYPVVIVGPCSEHSVRHLVAESIPA